MKTHIIDRENVDRKNVASVGTFTYCGMLIKNACGQVVRPNVPTMTKATAMKKDLHDKKFCQRCRKASRLD